MNKRDSLFFISTILMLEAALSTTGMAQEKEKVAPKDVDAIGHQPTALENTFKLCRDGEDNDSDTYVDCDDQDCWLFAICAKNDDNTDNTDSARETDRAADAEAPSEEEEQVIDLDSLDETESAPPPPPVDSAQDKGDADGSPSHGHGHGGGTFKPPKLKLFFDLLLEYEFETKMFQFTRDHAHIMLELEAADWLSFRGDIAFKPEFYEAVFSIKRTAEIRVGKVLVPFGQNEFHHLIGGRVDEDSLFLPTVWGDFGIAFKHFLYDGDLVSFDYALWVINGFQDSVDPNGNPTPGRTDGYLDDNNQMKGIGLRPTLHIGRSVTIGTSWYLDAWDPDNENFMLIYGADLDLGYDLVPVPVLKNVRIRAEVAWSEIRLTKGRNAYHGIFSGEPNGIMANFGLRRAGYNFELSYRILRWLFLRYREGLLNDDNRIRNANDLLIHEPGVVVIAGPVWLTLVGQIHTMLATKQELEDAGTPDEPNHSRIILRMMLRY